MSKFTQVATIPKTAERCEAEGLGITEWQLRSWCRAGALPTTKAGRKSLIYWPNLLRFLESGIPEREEESPASIRKIPE